MKINLSAESLYFRDIHRYPVLTDKEERDLVKRIQRQEPGSYNLLITSNLRFVISISKAYYGRGLSVSDIINEGNLGLILAAKRFDLNKKIKFISYAVWWIRQRIQKAIYEQDAIRIPFNKKSLVQKFKREVNLNYGSYDKVINSKQFKIYEDDINRVLNTKIISFDTKVDDESNITFQDILGENPQQEKDHEKKELHMALDKILQTLSCVEERVLRMYFGINLNRQFTLDEIGQELNITRERARLTRDRAIRRIARNPRHKYSLTSFVEN
jgi:RNA polymerase primary sigma factor